MHTTSGETLAPPFKCYRYSRTRQARQWLRRQVAFGEPHRQRQRFVADGQLVAIRVITRRHQAHRNQISVKRWVLIIDAQVMTDSP